MYQLYILGVWTSCVWCSGNSGNGGNGGNGGKHGNGLASKPLVNGNACSLEPL